MRTKRGIAMALMLGLTVSLSVITASADEKKTFVFGDTTFNAENEEADVNPQNTYAGWACIRYGIGETLFKYSDDMEIEPWIAKEFENVDELTWKITLNDGVVFSNGRACDGEAVKESLESLVANHERAAGDLCIDSVEADGNTVTIKTTEPKPAMINYLCDPYGCIIDTDAGITEDGIVIGTGPYVATDLVTDDHLDLVKNENYWAGDVNIDEIRYLCSKFYLRRNVSYIYDKWDLLKDKDSPADASEKIYQFLFEHRIKYDGSEHREYLKSLNKKQ